MEYSGLQAELLKEHEENEKMLRQQLAILDQLSASMKQGRAKHLLNKSFLIFLELGCYIMFFGSLALTIFLSRMTPFYLLNTLRFKEDYAQRLGSADVELLYWSVIIFIIIIAILFFLIARVLRTVRQKNDLLNYTGKQIQSLKEQQTQRLSETTQHTHPDHTTPDSYALASPNKRVNDVQNPGY